MLRKFAAALAIAFLPVAVSAQVTCKTTTFKGGCGPVMTGAVTLNKGHNNRFLNRVLTLNTKGAPKLSLGLIVIGTKMVKPWQLPFMNKGCTLIVNVVGHRVARSKKDGTSKAVLLFPAIAGMKLYFQTLWFKFGKGGVSADTSSGVALECTKSK